MHTTLLPLSSPSIPFLTAASCCHRSMLGERFSLQQGAAPLRAAPIQIELPLAKSICCKLCHPNRLTKSICCHLNRPAPFDSVRSWTNQPAGGQIDLSPPDSSRSPPDSSRHHLNRSSVARSTTAGCFCQCRMWELELGLVAAGESGHRGRAPSSADSRALPELGRWARSAWPELWRRSCSARPKLRPRPRSARAPPVDVLRSSSRGAEEVLP